MAKVLVAYRSKYGYTKKYAQWLAAELDADIFPVSKIRPGMLDAYSTIILGSGVYAGNIGGTEKLFSNLEKLAGKKLIIFTCGIADVSDAESMAEINAIISAKIPEAIRAHVKIFNLQGGIDYGKLSFKHKIMMGIVHKAFSSMKIENLSYNNRMFLESYGKNNDFTDKKNIAEIVDYCMEPANPDEE